MTMTICPVCGQRLPQALDEQELRRKIQRLISPVLVVEKQKNERDFRKRLIAEREAVVKDTERRFQREILQLQQSAQRAEREKGRAIEQARRQAEKAAARNVAHEVRLTSREYEAKMEKLEAAREKDHLRHEVDRARLQAQLDHLSRKLEKQTGEQRGEEAEADLFAQLREAFPVDQIERIGRGIKGADIVQSVMDEGRVLGRLVYECKNVAAWQNQFITQAKRYQTQYETPNVLIVTRAFPRKQRGLCIVKSIPVVDTHAAVSLASIIREGILEIAKMRLTHIEREGKAHELFEYVLSDRFATRFREIADSVGTLREQQQKERDWHENVWVAEGKLYDKIEARRREIDVQIKAITRGAGARPIPIRRALSA